MGLFVWVIIGVLVGIAVNRLHPAGGRFPIAMIIAVTGALVGGYVCTAFNMGTLTTLEPKALFAALTGSLLFVFLFRKLRIS